MAERLAHGGRAARSSLDSADQVEDEIELRAGRVVVLQIHRAADVAIGPGTSRDREDAVAAVEKRALDRDLAAGQEGRPVALPGPGNDDPDAVTLVAADLRRVGGVEDVVGKGEDVAGVVTGRAVG